MYHPGSLVPVATEFSFFLSGCLATGRTSSLVSRETVLTGLGGFEAGVTGLTGGLEGVFFGDCLGGSFCTIGGDLSGELDTLGELGTLGEPGTLVKSAEESTM